MTEQEWIERERKRFEAEFAVPDGVMWAILEGGTRIGYVRFACDPKVAKDYQLQWETWLAAKREAVPDFAREIGKRMRAQDNRITRAPLFVVFQKTDVVVYEDYYHDMIVWVDDEGRKADAETVTQLNDIRSDIDSGYYMDDEIGLGNDEGGRTEWRRLLIKQVDEFVTACFTEKGAKDFLQVNGHNLRSPFIYATSLFRNHEMTDLRDWLLNAAPPPGGDDG